MTFPVLVEPDNGQFVAELVGAPSVRKAGPTRAEAVAALKAELEQRVRLGELLSLDVAPAGVSGLAGRFAGDQTLRDICEEAYRGRDQDATP